MPALLTTRGVPRSIACAALTFATQFAFAADSGMRVLNPPGALIVDGAINKRITVQVPPQSATGGAKVVATLYRYDDNADPLSTAVTTFQAPATGDKRNGQVSFNVALPNYGLFLLDTKLVSASGAESDSLKINIAALAPGNGAFPDAGVVTHFGQRKGSAAAVLPLVKRAGFTWIRDELYWGEVEKTAGKFTFPPDNGNYGDYVAQAVKLNLKPLIVLDYGNPGAYPNLFKGPQRFPQTQQERDLFARYAQKVVGYYGKQVKHWEIWNEPAFAKIGYDNYVALLKPVYTAIKSQSADANVISCGGGGAGGGPGGDCIAELIKRGALDYQDGFSIHPYMSPSDPDVGYSAKGSPLGRVNVPNVWPHLARMTQANPKPGEGKLKLWITEIGWPSSPSSAGLSEQRQAAYVARTFLLSRRFDAVEAVIWYDFVDDGLKPSEKEHNFGLVRLDLSPKPAYVAASVLMKTVGTKKWDHALVDRGDIKVYQYGSDDKVIVGWKTDTDANASPTAVPIPPGTYTQRDWQGAASTVVVKDGFQWELGALPKYLIPASK